MAIQTDVGELRDERDWRAYFREKVIELVAQFHEMCGALELNRDLGIQALAQELTNVRAELYAAMRRKTEADAARAATTATDHIE